MAKSGGPRLRFGWSGALLPGAVLWGAVVGLAVLGPSRSNLAPSLAAYTVAFAALAHLWLRHPEVLGNGRVLIGGAVLLRLTLLPTLPDLSDDLYRYVWDGWLGVSGVNPFRYVPAAPELARFQASELFGALNSPGYHSIYPPLSQLVFLAGGALYEWAGWPAAAYGIKAGFLILETTGIYFLFRTLTALGRRPGTLALYAWNPLVLVTLAGGGHTEGGLVFGLGLLAWGVAAGGPTRGWVGLALATASKGIPVLLAPLLLRRHLAALGPRQTLRAILPAAVLSVVLLAPFYFGGLVESLAASADLYVRSFEFNAGPYALIETVLIALTGTDWGRVIGPALRWAFLAATLGIWIRWPIEEPESFFRAGLAVMGLYLLTATTVHPWYLVWGLVWIPLTPYLRWAWMWASWAAFLTYFFYTGTPGGLLASIFWGGVAVLLALELEGPIRDLLLRIAGRRKGRQLLAYLTGVRILDLGAGEGYVAKALARRGLRPIMVDVGRYARVPLPAVVYDGRRLPFADRSVDTVLLSLALHHADDPEAVAAEALRVAEGRVVVTESTYRFGWEYALLRVADRWANRGRAFSEEPDGERPPRFRTPEEWEEAFRRLGADLLRSERLNRLGHRHHVFVLAPGHVDDAGRPTAPRR